MAEVRINEDHLDFDEDVRTYNDLPFSGVGFTIHADGSLESEAIYVDGFREGLGQEWYPNGQIRSTWFAKRGQARGTVTEWHSNGAVKSVGQHEYGMQLQFDEWDCHGKRVMSRKIGWNAEVTKYVEEMRKKNA